MHDDGPHEIQLHGKQLVFVVMTATVVAVAIFLCGVLVGRGVPAPRPEGVVERALSADPLAVDPLSTDGVAPSASELPSDTLAPPAAGAATVEAPSYGPLLEAQDPVQETFERQTRPSPAEASAVAAPVRPVAARQETPRPSPPPPARSAAAAATTSGEGFVVQVSAVKGRAEAETIRKRLAGKGYAAFVEPIGSGGNALYRVRVGHYESRRAAQAIAARLEREERFKTWITR